MRPPYGLRQGKARKDMHDRHPGVHMRTTRSVAAALAVLAMAGTTGLSACSTSGEGATTASPNTSRVGGTAVCDEASLRSAIEASYSAEGADTKLLRVNEFECSDGWAVVFPDVGTNEENAVTVTEVLEAEGQFWLVKDRGAVCGTVSADDPATRPDDAQVPTDIWADACNTN